MSQQTVDSLPKTGLLRRSQFVPSVVPVSTRTLERMVKDKRFPQPLRISTQLHVWRAEDVHAWLQSLAA